jgi:hypothetical protein
MNEFPRYRECSDEENDEAFEQKTMKRAIKVVQVSHKGFLTLYQQEDIRFGYEIHPAFFVLCCDALVMLDFDFSEDFLLEDALYTLYSYTDFMHKKGIDLLFELYETDRGMHAFLVNQLIRFDEPEAKDILLDTCNDRLYTAFSSLRGFCVRLSPKVKRSEGKDEFVSRKMKHPRVGYGNPIKYALDILSIMSIITEWLVNNYNERFLDELKRIEYIPETDTVGIIIDRDFFIEATSMFKNLLVSKGLLSEGIFHFDPRYYGDELILENKYVAYEDDNIKLQYDKFSGIWILYTHDIVMLDFDDGDKEDFIAQLEEYVEINKQYTFDIYETDRGIHAFLVSKFITVDSDESTLILNESIPDNKAYIKKIETIKSYTIRVSPKLYGSKRKMKTQEEIKKEFVAKKCLGDICRIGNVPANSYIEAILRVHIKLIDIIKDLYNNSLEQIAQIDGDYYVPSNLIMDYLRNKVGDIIDEEYLNADHKLPEKQMVKLAGGNRYLDLLPETVVDKCRRQSIIERKKMFNNPDKRFTDDIPFGGLKEYMDRITKKAIEKLYASQIIMIRGPLYPFLLCHDSREKSNVSYILFYDMVTIKWDIIDGIPKDKPTKMLERLLLYERNQNRNMRITNSEMCFKVYETSDGINSFLVSHRIPYNSDYPSLLQLELCSDFKYAAFSKTYGFSSILSTKTKNQSIQRFLAYVGNTNNINPYLEALTNMIYNIQQQIIINWDKYNPTNNLIDYTEYLRSIVIQEYSQVPPVHIRQHNTEWARDVLSIGYKY